MSGNRIGAIGDADWAIFLAFVVLIFRDITAGKMNTASLAALIVSCLSLVVSGISLGWNIYKEIYLRARLRLSFALMVLVTVGNHRTWRYSFSVANLGPGKVKLQGLMLMKWSLWRKLTRTIEHAVVLHEYNHPLGGTLPCDLDVGQTTQFTFTPEICKFLGENFTHIGMSDSFGRIHWCRRRDMEGATKEYRKKAWVKKETETAT